jgi:hypothetical protein
VTGVAVAKAGLEIVIGDRLLIDLLKIPFLPKYTFYTAVVSLSQMSKGNTSWENLNARIWASKNSAGVRKDRIAQRGYAQSPSDAEAVGHIDLPRSHDKLPKLAPYAETGTWALISAPSDNCLNLSLGFCA